MGESRSYSDASLDTRFERVTRDHDSLCETAFPAAGHHGKPGLLGKSAAGAILIGEGPLAGDFFVPDWAFAQSDTKVVVLGG